MRFSRLTLAIAALLVLGGCVSSSRARKVTPSGFLGDSATLLKKGSKDEALLVYKNGKTDWKSYDKIVLDPVTLWGVENSNLAAAELADYQELVNSFHATLKEKLSKDYAIVEEPAPGAMRLQLAIINGKPATATLKVVKTVAPFAGYADALWTFATGKPAFAGEASIEGMVKDSESQELLAAWADRRVGGNQLGEATVSDWGDVENILTFYSDHIRYLLCVQRKAKDCKKPSSGIVENPVY
ncbi:MAG TPA: DUF3313 domain-containing protein [Thermoanaerobaculia bacterium]|jgi:hypothetical protein